MPYMLQGNCVHKENPDGTPGEKVPGGCYDTRDEAMKRMQAMNMATADEHKMYLLDNFVSTKPGEPYRLLPFGTIVKGGRKRTVTPESAAKFRLPHFKPPLKLGSHEETTPAGGHIVGLEVRADGLYAILETNDRGAQALADGSYRYHSPEVVWEEGGLEDPLTGELISGPLIIGDALLHRPHLGESAALYEVQTISKETSMSEDTYTVPKSIWDKFNAWIDRATTPPQEPDTPQVDPDQFAAAVKERDSFKSELETLKAEATRKSRIEKFETELKETKADPTLAELLAGLPDEQADVIMRQIKALSAQADASTLTEPIGSEGGTDTNPVAAFDAAVKRVAAEKKVDYAAAVPLTAGEHPDLYAAYVKATKEK